ncbi:MAG: hypothetical protein IJ583_03685 [Firmicutes bacterium]|nr:hypothetical protein [Bacillota bacterium]
MKIRVKPIFCIAAAVICLLGYAEEFFIMLIFAIVHECGHIVMAWIFGKKCRRINITPIGVYAEIEKYDEGTAFERICIALAGPAVNIIIAVLCRCMGLLYIYDVNITLALFNMMMIYPLDGGRIVKCVCECFMGIASSDKTVMRCTYIGAVLLMGAGILQTVLFPYNISLICLGKYLMKINEEEKVWLGYRSFERIKGKIKRGEVLEIKRYAIAENTEIKSITEVMGNDHYCVFALENGEEISEREVIGYIEENGIVGKVGDMRK